MGLTFCPTIGSLDVLPRQGRTHGGPPSRWCHEAYMARQGSYWEPSRRLRVGPFRRDVPAPTEGLIDGHEGGGGQGFAVREKILRCQESAFGIEDREKVGHPEAVPAPCPPMETESWRATCGCGRRDAGRGVAGRGDVPTCPCPGLGRTPISWHGAGGLRTLGRAVSKEPCKIPADPPKFLIL